MELRCRVLLFPIGNSPLLDHGDVAETFADTRLGQLHWFFPFATILKNTDQQERVKKVRGSEVLLSTPPKIQHTPSGCVQTIDSLLSLHVPGARTMRSFCAPPHFLPSRHVENSSMCTKVKQLVIEFWSPLRKSSSLMYQQGSFRLSHLFGVSPTTRAPALSI